MGKVRTKEGWGVRQKPEKAKEVAAEVGRCHCGKEERVVGVAEEVRVEKGRRAMGRARRGRQGKQ